MTPAVRVRADTVLTRRPGAGSLARFRPAVSASFVAPAFADSQTGTLIWGGIVAFEQVGATSIPLAYGRLLPLSRGVRDTPAMRRYQTAGSFTAPVFADSATGSVVFTGASAEAKVGADSPAGVLIWGGSVTESASLVLPAAPVAFARALPLARGIRDVSAMRRYVIARSFTAPTFADSATGALIFTGSRTEAKAASDSRAGTLIFGGSVAESASAGQTQTGVLMFSGSVVEHSAATPVTWVRIGVFVRVS